jgi:hypothetical protein
MYSDQLSAFSVMSGLQVDSRYCNRIIESFHAHQAVSRFISYGCDARLC